MKYKSTGSPSLLKRLGTPLIIKLSISCLFILLVYVGSWPLAISNTYLNDGYERKHFLTNKPVKVYYYYDGHIIKWLEAIEKYLNNSHWFAVAPNTNSWVNREKIALFASQFYYPLEWLSSESENQSTRMYFITNSENIRKFNQLSEDEKRQQFNQLSEYHGKLFYLDNSSSINTSLPYQDIDKSFYKIYKTIPFRFFINSNTELKPGCCGQSGDGFDEYCYNNTSYNNMMIEALNFISWYNHYSLANTAIKMIQSRRAMD